MRNQDCFVSPVTRRRLESQGYVGFTDAQLYDSKFGIRFAYYLCGLLVLSGLIFSKVELLVSAMTIAFLATFPPYHPFDYLYNYAVRHLLKKEKVPPRTNQGRFACGIASVWVGVIILLLERDLEIWAYLAGAILLTLATLVSTMDICVPSIVYNFLFPAKKDALKKSSIRNVAAFIILLLSFPGHAQEAQPMIAKTAPAFTLPDLNGKIYSLEQMKGRYTVIHFAATWCPFCNAEAPHLEKLSKDYAIRGVQVLIVDVKEDAELVRKSLSRFNFSFPVLLDIDGKVSASYAPPGVQPDLERHEVPLASNLIIDEAGIIRFYSLLNTTAFDAKLSLLRQTLDSLIDAK